MIGRAWSDGGNRAEIAACAVHLLLNEDGAVAVKEVKEARLLPGGTTNMEAEYQGVILAMETAIAYGVENLQLHVDNQTVDRHLRGIYKVRDARMRNFWDKCMELGDCFKKVEIKWVPREQNRVADALCRRKMDGKKPAKRSRPVPLQQQEPKVNPFTRSQ